MPHVGRWWVVSIIDNHLLAGLIAAKKLFDRVLADLAKVRRHCQLLLGIEVLIVEKQHAVFIECPFKLAYQRISQWLFEVDTIDYGTQRAVALQVKTFETTHHRQPV